MYRIIKDHGSYFIEKKLLFFWFDPTKYKGKRKIFESVEEAELEIRKLKQRPTVMEIVE